MTITIRHATAATARSDAATGLLQSLRRQGVTVMASAPGEPASGDAVLSFASVDDAALDAVRALSAGGRFRVLAVCAQPQGPDSAEHWRLIHAGASDVVPQEPATAVGDAVLARLSRWCEVDTLLASDLVASNLVGHSAAWRQALRQAIEAARFSDASVLVCGESGTGKELIARLIHTLDARPHKRELVTLDCTTLVPELTGSELFGHERGAFTGAVSPRDGAFALAHQGTLFLDEIGELPLALQPQLLRVIQERQFKRVGGNAWYTTDFRLVCATHRPLATDPGGGGFRADLYYRLAHCVLRLPPLRQRHDDILLLAEHFARQCTGGAAPVPMCAAVRDYLLRRPYPGNVRELRQLVAQMCARHVGPGPLTVGDIPPEARPAAGDTAAPDWRDDGELERAIDRALALGAQLKDLSQHATETAIRLAVDHADGNLQRAARRLGMSDRALQLRRAQRRQLQTP